MFVDKPYPLAAETIDLLRCQGTQVVYLSGRFRKPADKGRVTLEFMKMYGLYKEGDVAIFKPSASVHDMDFKRDAISSLREKYNILWAIDDTPHNLKIFKMYGIFCIGITTSYSSLKFDFADLVVEGWDEIKKFVENFKPVSQT
jgi:phosphoglycolate phosphatase-like HAD superfamily hydrolase